MSATRTARTAAATPAEAQPQVEVEVQPETQPEPAPRKGCGCGCGSTPNKGRAYLPGHDARHAGQVGRALAAAFGEGRLTEEEHARLLQPLSPSLAAKANRFLANRVDALAKAQAKAAEAAAAVAKVLAA